MKKQSEDPCCCCGRKSLVILVPLSLLFGWFVWPTLYKPTIVRFENNGTFLYRENRITGQVEDYWWVDGKWRLTDKKSRAKADQETKGL
jgi:hypothetical protein